MKELSYGKVKIKFGCLSVNCAANATSKEIIKSAIEKHKFTNKWPELYAEEEIILIDKYNDILTFRLDEFKEKSGLSYSKMCFYLMEKNAWNGTY